MGCTCRCEYSSQEYPPIDDLWQGWNARIHLLTWLPAALPEPNSTFLKRVITIKEGLCTDRVEDDGEGNPNEACERLDVHPESGRVIARDMQGGNHGVIA